MASTGFKLPGTTTDLQDVGTGPRETWNTPNNAQADDDTFTNADPNSSVDSNTLRCRNFDFSAVPSGATIDGIEVELHRKGEFTNPAIRDEVIRISIDTVAADPTDQVGDNNADTGTDWGTTEATVTTGSPTDLWTSSPTQTKVTAATWGVDIKAQHVGPNAFAGKCYIDVVKMNIYYTAAGGSVIRQAAQLLGL